MECVRGPSLILDLSVLRRGEPQDVRTLEAIQVTQLKARLAFIKLERVFDTI